MLRTLLVLCGACLAWAAAADDYVITDLGTLGGDDSAAAGINNLGQVVGDAEVATGTRHAFLWQDGVMSNLEDWRSFSSDWSFAFEINDAGIIVGEQYFSSTRGFAAADGSFIFTTTGGGSQSVRDINSNGQILIRAGGEVEIHDLASGESDDLGFMSGVAINDLGQVAGGGIFWDEGVYTQLGDLGSCCTDANDLNNRSQVVGLSNTQAGRRYPFVWDAAGGIRNLGTLGGTYGAAAAINDAGDIVGTTFTAGGLWRATLWRAGGEPLSLTDLVSDLSGWQYLREARDINEGGQIVGIGVTDEGNLHAYLLTPDSDADTVPDTADNCLAIANEDQRDTNGDGYGNVCDPDLNDDGIVNAADLGVLKGVFFGTDEDADFNGDGVVNTADLAVMRSLFFLPPGPSALAAP